jgi:hypothetical protein
VGKSFVFWSVSNRNDNNSTPQGRLTLTIN